MTNENNVKFVFNLKESILAVEYFKCFAPLFVNLIKKNTKSLKKMVFNGNQYQMLIFQNLIGDSEDIKALGPTHLSLALNRPLEEELNWNHLCQFIRDRCLKLEKLSLEFTEGEHVENVRSIIEVLTLVNCPLQSFNFELKGNTNAVRIELGGLLNKLAELKELIITDTKSLDPDVKYIVGGGRFWRYRLHSCFGFTPAHSDELIRGALTNISPTFMTQLPQKIDKLRIKCFMPETNVWLETFQNPASLESFKNLTKLEICGPYIHSMHLVVPKILTLVNLETLALPNCDIQDTYITGLGWQAVMDLRRCLTTCFTLSAVGPGSSSEDIKKAIREAPNYVSKNQILATERLKLSNLPKLKSLDLSNNPQISDLGIYDSMSLPLLEHLILRNCSRVTDIGLSMIGLNLPSIKILNVKSCRKMTKFGINELIKVCKNLKRVHTTKVVSKATIQGFRYKLCSSFDDIVSTSNDDDTKGFFQDEMLDA